VTDAGPRVALLLDSLLVPRYVRALLEGLAAPPVVVVLSRTPRPDAPGARHALYRLYRAADRRLFAPPKGALAPVDVSDLLRGCPVVEVEPIRGRDSDFLHPKDADRVRAFRPDVALRFGFLLAAGEMATLAPNGVWSLRLDGVTEVVAGAPTTEIALEARDGAGTRTLARSVGQTDRRSAARNLEAAAWKAPHLFLRKLKELARDGRVTGEPAAGAPPDPPPRNLRMAALSAGHAARYLRDKLVHLATAEQWYLAYRFEDGPRAPTDFAGMTPWIPPRDRFWADPFPFEHEGRFYVFLEELLYRDWRGRIAVAEVDPLRGPSEPRTVLERDHHLSYPFVFRWQDRIYMMPEMSAARRVALFRCRAFPHEWEEEHVLLDGVDAVDATLEEVDGRWWMFVNIGQPGADNCDELHLFHADTPLGPWRPHPRNPVRSDCRAARPAGRLFRWNGQLYRPAQNCGPEYGWSIVLHRVERLDTEDYREERAGEITAWRKGAERTHTMNRCGKLFVADLLRRRCRLRRR
jgi:hypothetical protein